MLLFCILCIDAMESHVNYSSMSSRCSDTEASYLVDYEVISQCCDNYKGKFSNGNLINNAKYNFHIDNNKIILSLKDIVYIIMCVGQYRFNAEIDRKYKSKYDAHYKIESDDEITKKIYDIQLNKEYSDFLLEKNIINKEEYNKSETILDFVVYTADLMSKLYGRKKQNDMYTHLRNIVQKLLIDHYDTICEMPDEGIIQNTIKYLEY